MSDATTATDVSDSQSSHGRSLEARRRARQRKASVALGNQEVESDDGVDLFGEDAEPVPKRKKALKRKKTSSSNSKKPTKKQALEKATWKDPNTSDGNDDETSNSDDDAINALPEYVKKRRAAFEERRAKYEDAGLKLPPSYDDIDFSEYGDLRQIKERPDFPTAIPVRKYEDIALKWSLGVIPASISQWLREYQVVGAQFLHKKFIYQEGGILGDDMGLGKTIQVISFLTAAFGKTGDERDILRMRKVRRAPLRAGAKPRWYPRVIIICPGTLFENWRAELNRWGWWHIECYHGEGKEDAIDAARAGRVEIMLTTYTTYRLDKDIINHVAWDAVIADECHIIKGRKSETTKAMNEINALCRLGLTGTAIQNTYDELWTLLNWTSPGALGSAAVWKQTITNPLRLGQSHGATMHQLARARKTAEALTINLLPRFFLRRMKTLIADQLPKKTDRVVFCSLTDTQAIAYERFLDSHVLDLIKRSTDVCDCGEKNARGKPTKRGWCCYQLTDDGKKWQEYVFPCVNAIQKLANHLAILIPQDTDKREKQEKDLVLLQETMPEDWKDVMESRNHIKHYANPEFCGKWKVLKKLLRFWHESGDKVLVFSHSVRLLRMLRMLFQSTSYNVSYLDGSMPLDERAKEVDVFNADPDQFVFLISTKAGGVGLNITSANKVVIFDPNWNPAYDLQAQDRAYRIGQTRNVEVFRLICSGTIEEIVYARQIYKQQQANIGYTASKERRYFQGVQENPEQKGEIFGLKNLFAYQGENIVLRDIVNKTNVAESKAGVAVADVDFSQADTEDDPLFSGQGDDEDGVMSQLAKLVAKGVTDLDSAAVRSKKGISKSNPVQAILAEAGVEYTHDNSEVIGSSRVEARISKAAAATGDNFIQANRHAFADTQEREALSRREGDIDELVDESDDVGKVDWRFNPPEDVKRRQFCTMAHTFGFESAEQFALVVEGWTQAQRRNCLDRFYALRRERLGLAKDHADEAVSEAANKTGDEEHGLD